MQITKITKKITNNKNTPENWGLEAMKSKLTRSLQYKGGKQDPQDL